MPLLARAGANAPASIARASFDEAGHGSQARRARMRRAPKARGASGPDLASQAPRPGRHADLVPLEAYLVRADELLARIETGLAAGGDRARLAVMVDELADDLASVGAPDDLRDALRRLADALRGSGDPRAALAAARRDLARPPAPSLALPRPAQPAAEPESRRRWWR